MSDGLGAPPVRDEGQEIPPEHRGHATRPDWKGRAACDDGIAKALAHLSDVVLGVRAKLDDWPDNMTKYEQQAFAEDLALDLLEVQSELNEAGGRNILGEKENRMP